MHPPLLREGLVKEWKLPPEGLLCLHSIHGNVQIVGTDEPKVHLELEKLAWAEDEATARSLLDQIFLEDRQEDNRLFLTVRTPHRVVFYPHHRFQINLSLHVPRTLRIEADHSHGDVTVEGTGPLHLTHEHGNVEIQEVKEAEIEKEHGNVTIERTESLRLTHEHGNVKIQEVKEAEIKKEHGNLRLQKAEGKVVLRGAHGERHLSEVKGDLIAETEHGGLLIENPGGAVMINHSFGPVTLRYTYPPSGPLQVRNAHGPVTVEFPPLSSVNLNLRVFQGSITGTGIEPGGRLTIKRHITQSVILGEGQWPATIEVEHGSVHVRSEPPTRVSTQETPEETAQGREREQTLREERLIILRLLQEGKITPEEAEALLNALGERPSEGRTSSQEEPSWSDWQQKFQHHFTQAMREWEQQMRSWQQHFDPGKFINRFFSQIQIDSLINNISRFAEAMAKNFEERFSDLSAGEKVEALREEVIHLDPETSSLEVSLPQGRIEVTPGPSPHVKILLRARGKDQETANQRLRQAQIVSTPGPHASIRVETPPDLPRYFSAEVKITCPENKSLTLQQKKGSIVIQGWKGEITVEQAEGEVTLTEGEAQFEVKNASGSVTLTQVKGRGKVVAVNGEIEVKDYEGPIEIEIAQGEVEMERLKAEGDNQVRVRSGNAEVEGEDMEVPQLLVETMSAPIHLERIKGDLSLKSLRGTVVAKELSSEKIEVQSSEGDILLSFKDPFSGNLRAETLTGKIRVRLPQDSRANFEILSGSGQITVPSEITLLEETPQYRKGVLGEGQGQISLKSGTGTITLELK